jgi:hypothetical protein
MLVAGCVITGSDVLGILDLIELVIAPFKPPGKGGFLEISYLL